MEIVVAAGSALRVEPRHGIVAPVIGATRVDYIDDAAAAVSISLTEQQIRFLEEPYLFRAWHSA